MGGRKDKKYMAVGQPPSTPVQRRLVQHTPAAGPSESLALPELVYDPQTLFHSHSLSAFSPGIFVHPRGQWDPLFHRCISLWRLTA